MNTLQTLLPGESAALSRPPSGRAIVAVLGGAAVLGLLTAPGYEAWLGAALLLGLAAFRWWRFGGPLPRSPFLLPFTLSLGGAVLGLLVAAQLEEAQVRLSGLLAPFALCYLVPELVRTNREARRAVNVALVCAAVVVPVLFLLSVPVISGRLQFLEPAEDVVMPLRQALFRADPQLHERVRLFAAGVGTAALWGMGLTFGPLLTTKRPRTRLLAALALLEFGIFAVLSASRAVVLGVLLIALLLGAVRFRWLLAVAGLLVIATVVALSGLVDLGSTYRVGESRGFQARFSASVETFRTRHEMWRNAFFLMEDFRFTGVGLGLPSATRVYNRHFPPFRIPHTHNIFVQSYLEQGVIGFVGFVAIFGVAVGIGVRELVRNPTSASIAGSGAVLALGWYGLVEIAPLSVAGTLMLGIGLALLLVARRVTNDLDADVSPKTATPTPLRTRRQPVLLAGASALAILLALVITATASATWASSSEAWRTSLAQMPRPLRGAAAALALNLGAVEVNRAYALRPSEPVAAAGHVATARAYLLWSLELNPNSAAAYRNLAEAALVVQEPQQARTLLIEAERHTAEGDSSALLELGRLYRAADDVPRGVAAWLRTDPSLGAWSGVDRDTQLIEWGQSLVRQRRWQDAIAVNRAAIEAAPTAVEPFESLASAMLTSQGEERLLDAMRALAESHPSVPWPLEQIEASYRRTSREALADEWRARATAVRASDGWAIEQQRMLDARGHPLRLRD